MKNTNDPEIIASAVLTKISVLDRRFNLEPEKADITIQAWAEVLDIRSPSYIWLNESLDAVKTHYQESEFSITPKDIIDRVAKMPMDSSPERLREWILDFGTKYPFANAVQTMAQMDFYPSVGSADKDEASRQMHNWLTENLNQVQANITRIGWQRGIDHVRGGPEIPPLESLGAVSLSSITGGGQ